MALPILRIQRDVEWVMKILKEEGDVNVVNDRGKTPLMCVLKFYDHNRTDIFCELIKNGADVNACDPNGRTVLMLACKSYYNEELINLLLDSGADVKCKDKMGNTVLHYIRGSYKGFIPLFVRLGVPIDVKNNEGMTPLTYVLNERHALYCSLKVKLLLTLGSNPNTLDVSLKSPIWYAGNEAAVNLLYYYGANIITKSKEGDYLLKVILKRDFITDSEVHIFRHAALFHTDELFSNIDSSCKYIDKCNPLIGMSPELNEMKTTDIRKNLSFYKFCNLKRRKFNRFVNIDEYEYLYDKYEIKEMFPQFYSIIIMRIKDNKIQKRKHDLIRNLDKIIIKPLNSDVAADCDIALNYDCLEVIYRYLNHKDLYNLFLASVTFD